MSRPVKTVTSRCRNTKRPGDLQCRPQDEAALKELERFVKKDVNKLVLTEKSCQTYFSYVSPISLRPVIFTSVCSFLSPAPSPQSFLHFPPPMHFPVRADCLAYVVNKLTQATLPCPFAALTERFATKLASL
eukprot:615339-Rhodomonas_salina.1